MRKRKGFTLIELLVVISIIALLLSILMPALTMVKQKAATIVCMTNQKNLSYAWNTYAVDNNDEMVSGYCDQKTMANYPAKTENWGHGSWVEPPQDDNGNYLGNAGLDVTMEERLNGLKKGMLYSYLDTPKVFHCPGDTRFKRGTLSGGTNDASKIYRSYSITDGATAWHSDDPSSFGYRWATKIGQLKYPANKHVFIEEAYDGLSYNYNDASWNFLPYLPPAQRAWWDPLALYHADTCTIGFSDAHAERYKFKEKETIDFFTDRGSTNQVTFPNNIDIEYFQKGWAGLRAQSRP